MGVGNSGQHNPGDEWIQPGRIRAPMSTGAGEGSQGGQVSASTGDLATVHIVPVYESSQSPLDMVPVDHGDTFGGSSDNPMALFVGGEQSSAAWAASSAHVVGDQHPGAS